MTRAYEEGCERAAGLGATEDDCPYPNGSSNAYDWLIGFRNTIIEQRDNA